jgi:hypothetical protein
MRNALAGAMTLLLLVCPKSEPQLTSASEPLILTHATVIDVTGGPPKQNYSVVITGDRITEVAESAKVIVPAASTVVDATGKFLIPGLRDMHVHLADKALLPLFIANGVTGCPSDVGNTRIPCMAEVSNRVHECYGDVRCFRQPWGKRNPISAER